MDEKAFERMVSGYRDMGVRMVLFFEDRETASRCGSWVMAFYTHGVDADMLPLHRFANPEMLRGMRTVGFGSLMDVCHHDVTDHVGMIVHGYRLHRLVVQQLV